VKLGGSEVVMLGGGGVELRSTTFGLAHKLMH
jgi:hypothetical protein